MKKKNKDSDILETKPDILKDSNTMNMIYDVGFMKNEDVNFNLRDKIILCEFVSSVSHMSNLELDPSIVESANKLKTQIYNDCNGDMSLYRRLRSEIISSIDRRYHIH